MTERRRKWKEQQMYVHPVVHLHSEWDPGEGGREKKSYVTKGAERRRRKSGGTRQTLGTDLPRRSVPRSSRRRKEDVLGRRWLGLNGKKKSALSARSGKSFSTTRPSLPGKKGKLMMLISEYERKKRSRLSKEKTTKAADPSPLTLIGLNGSLRRPGRYGGLPPNLEKLNVLTVKPDSVWEVQEGEANGRCCDNRSERPETKKARC